MPKIKDLFKFYLLSFTWGIVWTILGLLIFGIMWIFFSDQMKIRFIDGRIAVTMTNSRFGGVSLGIIYVVDRSDSRRLHLHELGHTIQNMYFGPLFIPVIAIPSFLRYHWRMYLKKNDYQTYINLPHYDAIWFEGEATALGEKHFAETIGKLGIK
jgi:hypothetical protein